MQLIPFLLNKRNIGEHVLAYFKLTQGYTRLLGSKKVRISYQFYFFHHIFVYNQKTIKFTKLLNASLESWPKNLSTVSRRVIINPSGDSFKSCFWVFCWTVNTPTKKKPHHEIPCYLPVLQHEPSKSKLMRKCCVFSPTEGSTLDHNISGSVQILSRIYILIRKVF